METYNTNSNFRHYVDKYCAQRHKSVEEALQDKIVQGVEKYHIEKASRVAGYSEHFMNKFTEVR